MILYTSGTTGRPKGARITYGMALFNAGARKPAPSHSVWTRRISCSLPTFHAAGLHLYANPIFPSSAPPTWCCAPSTPGRFLALLASKGIRITHLLGVPTNFLMMAQQPGFAEADLSHIVSIGVGGAAAPLALLETYAAKGVALQQLWGMTETGPLGLVLPGDEALRKVGSSGLPVQYARLKVCDEYGVEVEQGTTGELLIKGPAVDAGVLEPDADQHRSVHRRRLVSHRRRGASGRRRLLLHRRSLEGHVHFRRRERLPGRGGERDLPARRRSRDRGGRDSARDVGRGRSRVCCCQAGGAWWTSTASSRTAARISPVTRFHERCDSSTSCLTMRPERSSSTDCRASGKPRLVRGFPYSSAASSAHRPSSVPPQPGIEPNAVVWYRWRAIAGENYVIKSTAGGLKHRRTLAK